MTNTINDIKRELFLNSARMGYFIIYKGDDSKFSKAIEKRQILKGIPALDAEYTHIEVSGGERHSINISPPISRLIDIPKVHKNRYCKIVRYKDTEYERKGRYKVAYFSATLCNTGYDFFGILRFIFKWIKQANRLWFCSEGAAWALQKEYPLALGMNKPYNVMPAHFLNKDEFLLEWEGNIPNLEENNVKIIYSNK